MGARDLSRELEMCRRYRAGETLHQIGVSYGITRERVRQLIKPHGLNRFFGGMHVVVMPRRITEIKDRAERKRAHENTRYERTMGCSKEQFVELTGLEWSWTNYQRGTAAHPGNAYMNQLRNAETRDIPWELSFPRWWAIWQESGHWEQRGRGKGYCMARYGDSGPYSPENVYICTIGQNFSDSYLVSPWATRFAGKFKKAVRDELGLTPQQRRVFELRNAGFRNKDVAAHIGITSHECGWLWYKAKLIVGDA